MADSNYGNRNAAVQISDDDPFAELTRIMGQLQPGEAASDETQDAASEPSEQSDPFDMDLERELMGEFGGDAAESAQSYTPETPSAFGADSFAEEPSDAVPFDLDAGDAPFAASSDDHYERQPESESEDYWSGHQPAAESGTDNDQYFPATAAPYESAAADDLLSDLDIEFDEPDAESQPVADEPIAYEPDVDDVTASRDVSLEDELEMLLGAGADTAAARRDDELYEVSAENQGGAEALPEPAQSWHQSIFGRANQSPAHDDHEAAPEPETDRAAWDEIADTDYQDTPAVAEAPLQTDAPVDPFDALAHLADTHGAPQNHIDRGEQKAIMPAAPAAPVEVDTVDVPEMALAQHDDLELPDLSLEDEPPAGLAGADIETEFAYDFPTPGMRSSLAPESIVLSGSQSAGASDDNDIDDDDFINAALGIGTATAASAANATHAYAGSEYDQDMRSDDANPDGLAGVPYGQPAQSAQEPNRRTGFIVAGAVLAIAILGGIGAFALSFGGSDGADVPVLVKADDEPLKVKPENPGGESTVPNQDSVAYDAASGSATSEKPQQESLVSTVEEPINIASRVVDADRLPGVDEDIVGDDPVLSGKAEDRLDASANADSASIPANDVVAVQPRRVRTMIVRPDGTLVPREEAPVEEAVAAPATEPAMQPANEPAAAATERPALPLPGLSESTTAEPAPTVAEAQPKPVVTPRPVQTTAQPADPVMPRTGPILPSRPAEPAAAPRQQQVAQAAAPRPQPAAVPAPVATASSEWSMQIASQPSSESAQATYQQLARRYASILDGRGVNIVRADIPGKGTYYRVRVPSSSRNDGVALCERYKAAGGSCFVSK